MTLNTNLATVSEENFLRISFIDLNMEYQQSSSCFEESKELPSDHCQVEHYYIDLYVKVRGQLLRSSSQFLPPEPQDQTQLLKLGGHHFYLPSHLTALQNILQCFCHLWTCEEKASDFLYFGGGGSCFTQALLFYLPSVPKVPTFESIIGPLYLSLGLQYMMLQFIGHLKCNKKFFPNYIAPICEHIFSEF